MEVAGHRPSPCAMMPRKFPDVAPWMMTSRYSRSVQRMRTRILPNGHADVAAALAAIAGRAARRTRPPGAKSPRETPAVGPGSVSGRRGRGPEPGDPGLDRAGAHGGGAGLHPLLVRRAPQHGKYRHLGARGADRPRRRR